MPNPFTKDIPEDLLNLKERGITTRGFRALVETLNPEERTMEAVLTTSNPVPIIDWENYRLIDEILIAKGGRIRGEKGQVPLLDTHNRWNTEQVLGSVRDIRLEKDQIIGRLHFVEGDEEVERKYQRVAQGHLTDVSIGYMVEEYEDLKPGESRTINGQKYTAGERTLRVATAYEINEVSLVPIGADKWAKVREMEFGGNSAHNQEGQKKMEKVREFLIALGMRADATPEQLQAYREAQNDAVRKTCEKLEGGYIDLDDAKRNHAPKDLNDPTTDGTPAPEGGSGESGDDGQRDAIDPAEAQRKGAEAERARQDALREIATTQKVPENLLTEAIRSGESESEFKARCFEWLSGSRQNPLQGNEGVDKNYNIGRGRAAATADSLVAGLCLRGGMDWKNLPLGKRSRRNGSTEETLQARERLADAGEKFQDYALMDVLREAYEVTTGRQAPRGREELFAACRGLRAVSDIFSNVVGSVLAVNFEYEVGSARRWAGTRQVNNFHQREIVSVTKGQGFKPLAAGGDAAFDTPDGFKETSKLVRYAQQGRFDEIDIINDNLDALLQFPYEMAMDAAHLEDDLAYATILSNPTMNEDSTALFHADHNNLDSNAFNSDNLQTGLTAMAEQRLADKPLNIRARHLLVPTLLKWDAQKLLRSGEMRQAGNTDVEYGVYNPIQDEDLQLTSDSRLNATGVVHPLTGTTHTGSTTNWFLLAGRKTLTLEYLSGAGMAPVLRSAPSQIGGWGIDFDAKFDVAAAVEDWRGFYQGNT